MTTQPQRQRRAAFGSSGVKGAEHHPLDPTERRTPPPADLPKTEALAPFSTRMPPDFIKRVKQTALARDLTVQQAVYQALRQWIENPPQRRR